jgi:hypothetical protein
MEYSVGSGRRAFMNLKCIVCVPPPVCKQPHVTPSDEQLGLYIQLNCFRSGGKFPILVVRKINGKLKFVSYGDIAAGEVGLQNRGTVCVCSSGLRLRMGYCNA